MPLTAGRHVFTCSFPASLSSFLITPHQTVLLFTKQSQTCSLVARYPRCNVTATEVTSCLPPPPPGKRVSDGGLFSPFELRAASAVSKRAQGHALELLKHTQPLLFLTSCAAVSPTSNICIADRARPHKTRL